MLLERNQAVIGVIAAVVIGAGTVFAVTLQSGMFVPGYEVKAEFANAVGLEAGADVLVAGIRSGQVDSVEIEGDHILVELTTSAELPVDSTARIVNKNMLGSLAVQLVAGDDWDNLLEEQDEPVITLENTATPVRVPELGDETVELLRDSDAEAFAQLISSLADVTEGQHDELAQLLDGAEEFSRVIDEDRANLRAFIQRSNEVVNALSDRDQELVQIIDGFGATLDELAARRQDLVRLIRELRGASGLTADLIADKRAELDRVLNEIDAVLDIVDEHQVDLAHAAAYGGVAFKGFSTVAESAGQDNPYWGNILTSGIGPAGIDQFAGCGGVIDDVLDQIFGPVECPEEGGGAGDEEDGDGDGGDGGGSAASRTALERFFATRGIR